MYGASRPEVDMVLIQSNLKVDEFMLVSFILCGTIEVLECA